MLLAVCEATGKDYSCIPTIAKGFSVGMGGVGEVCGVVSGAMLALGLLYREDMSIGTKARYFSRQFAEENDALRCIDLLGFGEGSRDELIAYAKSHKSEICDGLLSSSVEILFDLVEDTEISKS